MRGPSSSSDFYILSCPLDAHRLEPPIGCATRSGAACNPIRAATVRGAVLHMLNQDSSDSNRLPQPCARDGFAGGPRADSSRDNHIPPEWLVMLRRDGLVHVIGKVDPCVAPPWPPVPN